MDQLFNVYANVEGPSQKKAQKSSDRIYANVSEIHTLEPNRAGPGHSGAGGMKRSHYIAAALCLGLLSLLLLTGLITLVCLYTKGNSEWKMEMVLLQTSYNNLTKQRDQLQTSYNNLTKQRDQLQTSYNNLTKQRDQLQTSYNNLTKQRDQLQTSYNNLIKQRDQLHKILEVKMMNASLRELQGWQYVSGGFYYISSLEKSWQESRNDCLQRGADLMIINSKEEQEFTQSFQKRMWIGLTDHEMEGTWKWVDGTPLTTSYWATSEPNGNPNRDEDCAEIKIYKMEKSWNDELCDLPRSWICEKKLA